MELAPNFSRCSLALTRRDAMHDLGSLNCSSAACCLARPELNTPARELSPGARGVGDAFIVEARNSGYDVIACDVRTGLMPRDCIVTEGGRLAPTV